MGFLAKILNFKGKKIKIDSGGGNVITAEHYAPAGDDSQPLSIDTAAAVFTARKGSAVVVGYNDNVNSPKAEAGEKRIYSRDAGSGEWKTEIWGKNDGTISLKNGACEFELKPTGAIRGSNNLGYFELTAAGVFVINGIDFATHVHGGVTSGTEITGPAEGP